MHAQPSVLVTYQAIARNLREFGYDGVSRNMIQEVHEAMQSGAELPYGVVGMFARQQLIDAGFGGEVDAREAAG